MANPTRKPAKKESLEDLQKKRNELYFQMGDKAYHIKALESQVITLAQVLSDTNASISKMMKEEDQLRAKEALRSQAPELGKTANA